MIESETPGSNCISINTEQQQKDYIIYIPKNSGLREYTNIALNYLDNLQNPKILETRGEDIPFWVSQTLKKGKKAIGLTGEDLFREYCLKERRINLKIIKKIEWDDPKAMFKKPVLCLIGPKNKSLEILPKLLIVAISSKYKKIARRYLNFLERKGFKFKKIYITGCVETSCTQGIADLIIDIVYTGSSIKRDGLKIYDKILESNYVIIGGNDD